MTATNHHSQLYGLVLSGGKSQRMGRDKGLLTYHDKPQREYLWQQLQQCCDAVFHSIRPEQQGFLPAEHCITDKELGKGPMKGIVSAHLSHPNVAWLVVACDLPFLDNHTIANLVSERDTIKKGTCYASVSSGLPEPLVCIWEPKALSEIAEQLTKGVAVYPRNYLINNSIKKVVPTNDEELFNANTIQEYNQAKAQLKP